MILHVIVQPVSSQRLRTGNREYESELPSTEPPMAAARVFRSIRRCRPTCRKNLKLFLSFHNIGSFSAVMYVAVDYAE